MCSGTWWGSRCWRRRRASGTGCGSGGGGGGGRGGARGRVVAAGLVLLTLVGGITGTTWGLLRAEQQRQLAEAKKREAVDERDAKASALKAEQQARADEKKARQQAFAALRSMTADVIERKFTQGTVLTERDRAFLRGVIAQYDAVAA